MTNDRWPVIAADDISWIETATMVEVDRIMIEDLHIELKQMMENAGRDLATVVMALHQPASVAVYAGSGGNGGGGLVAARHLANRGVEVTVVAARSVDELEGVTGHQMDIIERMGIRISEEPVAADVAVDALIGYSLRGAPRGRVAELIELLDEHASPIIALDVPSGVDPSTGETPGVAIEADVTLTLALPKVGMRGHPNVGRLLLGDISVPRSVYAGMGLPGHALFESGPILEITGP